MPISKPILPTENLIFFKVLLTKDSIAGAWSKNRNKIREYTKCKEIQTLKVSFMFKGEYILNVGIRKLLVKYLCIILNTSCFFELQGKFKNYSERLSRSK